MQEFLLKYAQIIYPFIFTWSLAWKGLALWKAVKKDSKIWFVVLLVLNTLGILEILYYFVLSKINYSQLKAKIGNLSKNIRLKWQKK